MAFLPDGHIHVTKHSARLCIISAAKLLKLTMPGLPETEAWWQGADGLLYLVTDEDNGSLERLELRTNQAEQVSALSK